MIYVLYLFIGICVSSLIIGGLRLVYLKRSKSARYHHLFSSWDKDVDVAIGALKVESPDFDFVDSRILARRGSWRLAQNRTLSYSQFERMLAEEFEKKL